jgi:hypothetical protein
MSTESGTFAVYLDGKRVGNLKPVDELKIACSPGTHKVSVRQWWYRSRPVSFSIQAGQNAVAEVVDPGQNKGLRSFGRFLFTPGSALTVLQPKVRSRTPEEYVEPHELLRISESLLANDVGRENHLRASLVTIAGLIVALIGLNHHQWWVAALGAVIAVVAMAVDATKTIALRKPKR